MRTIAFINEKGGSGKTTLAVNTAAYYALKMGKKVLLVDLDPQGQVGKALGFAVNDIDLTINEVLSDAHVAASDAILESNIEGLHVIVANKRLADFPLYVSADDRTRNRRLKAKLDKLSGYDYIIIDSPPSLGLITINIMLAVEEVVIPVNMTFFALDGCAEIEDTINRLKKEFRHENLHISLVVATLYRNTNLADAILDKLTKHFGKTMAKTIVRMNVKIDEAQSFGKTIWEYCSWSEGAKMLESFALELAKKK